MTATTALLVSADPSLTVSVQMAAQEITHLDVQPVPTYEAACTLLHSPAIAVLLAHVTCPLEAEVVSSLLRDLALARKDIATLVIAQHYEAEQALEFLRLGAADYLPRPLSLNRLRYLLDVLTIRHRIRVAEANPVIIRSDSAGMEGPFVHILSSTAEQLIHQVRRIAPLNVNILLTGETGTGKTCLARLIHDLSPRRDEPFLVVQCSALSAALIESEMFGHVRGAFTGAGRDHVGKFAHARGGTILLDDVEALPIDLQAKLLRVVEDHVFEPVGSNQTHSLRARLIAASNRNLEKEVNAGRFREDLFYRLNVFSLHLAPLREQLSLIPVLIDHFLLEHTERHHCKVHGITPEALAALQRHTWPGNIRELRNVLEKAVILCTGNWVDLEHLPESIRALAPPQAIDSAELPAPPRLPIAPETLSRAREAAEALLIREALARNGDNRLRTAAELGISRMTLYNKMHRYGLLNARAEDPPESALSADQREDDAGQPIEELHECRADESAEYQTRAGQ